MRVYVCVIFSSPNKLASMCTGAEKTNVTSNKGMTGILDKGFAAGSQEKKNTDMDGTLTITHV